MVVPRLGIEPVSLALEVRSLNCWTRPKTSDIFKIILNLNENFVYKFVWYGCFFPLDRLFPMYLECMRIRAGHHQSEWAFLSLFKVQ